MQSGKRPMKPLSEVHRTSTDFDRQPSKETSEGPMEPPMEVTDPTDQTDPTDPTDRPTTRQPPRRLASWRVDPPFKPPSKSKRRKKRSFMSAIFSFKLQVSNTSISSLTSKKESKPSPTPPWGCARGVARAVVGGSQGLAGTPDRWSQAILREGRRQNRATLLA